MIPFEHAPFLGGLVAYRAIPGPSAPSLPRSTLGDYRRGGGATVRRVCHIASSCGGGLTLTVSGGADFGKQGAAYPNQRTNPPFLYRRKNRTGIARSGVDRHRYHHFLGHPLLVVGFYTRELVLTLCVERIRRRVWADFGDQTTQ
jgi:hypothetical protein